MAENGEDSGSGKQKVVKEEIINVTEGAPAWMATFADLVTLLMCFFVLLFAMSTTQQETLQRTG